MPVHVARFFFSQSTSQSKQQKVDATTKTLLIHISLKVQVGLLFGFHVASEGVLTPSVVALC